MKKNLLIIAAMAVATTASAQSALTAKGIHAERNISTMQVETSVLAKDNAAMPKVRKANRLAAADPAGSIYGSYYCTELDSRQEAYGAHAIILEESNLKDEDGTVYNVLMKNFWMDGTEAYGVYDEAAGTLSFPQQYIAQSSKALGYTNEYGRFSLLSITADLKVNEGSMVLVRTEDGGFEPSEDLGGYYIYADDYVDEETKEVGAGWTYAFEPTFLPVNGYMNYGTTSPRFQIEQVDGWGDGENDINYQDFETNIIINGFLGTGVISIDINDDGTCSISLPQYLSSDWYGADYKYMRLIGVGDNPDRPGYIMIIEDKESSPGEVFRNVEFQGGITGDVIRFFGVENGKYTFNEYFYGASSADSDSRWYTLGGFFCAIELDLYKDAAAGIKENTISREQKLKETKTYNLMGQQVNRSVAKGLLIRDGKKYIAK